MAGGKLDWLSGVSESKKGYFTSMLATSTV